MTSGLVRSLLCNTVAFRSEVFSTEKVSILRTPIFFFFFFVRSLDGFFLSHLTNTHTDVKIEAFRRTTEIIIIIIIKY